MKLPLPPGWEESSNTQRVVWSRAGHGRRLIIVHGFGENAFRYRQFAHFLGDLYSEIVAVQLPGHGTAKGRRGDCESLQDFVAAIESALDREHPSDLFAHSFGGLVALWMMSRQQLFGVELVITSAPALALKDQPPYIKRVAGEVLARVAPHLALPLDIDARCLSREAQEVEAYKSDSLNHPWITSRTYFAMKKAMSEVLGWTGPLSLPWALLLPGSDGLIDPQVSFRYFLQMQVGPGAQKTLLSFPGHFHEAFNDRDRGPVFHALHSYLSTPLSGR